jgi:prolycopene isomerase
LKGWDVTVPRDYDSFLENLTALFPAERKGIRRFYGEAWKVRLLFNGFAVHV